MSIVFPDPLVTATYVALVATVLSLWAQPLFRYGWVALLVVAIVLGYFSGVLTGIAVVPIAVLASLCWYYRAKAVRQIANPIVRGILAFLILAVALLLGLHAFPGFNNPPFPQEMVLSPHSAPYKSYLNFDKTVAGLLLLGLCYVGLMTTASQWRAALQRAWPIIVVNIALVIGLAWALDYVMFDPKWTTYFIPWAVINLFFVCLTEEAFFRGFIQQELFQSLKNHRYGAAIAVGVSGVLFGLAHFAGGTTYVLLSTVAGVGYAIVYQTTGRIEMSMLTHFSLNATHFLLFTYPRAA